MIGEQKWNVILEILWLAHYNPEINWRIGEIKMIRYLEECGKQWRLEQRKPGWQKQKEEERKEKVGKKQEEREEKQRKEIQRQKKQIEVRKVVEEWEIWDEEEEAVKSEEEAKKLVLTEFHKWI